MLGIFKAILAQTLYLVSQFPINKLLLNSQPAGDAKKAI